MKRKLVSILTVAALSASMLVGCSSGKEEAQDQTQETGSGGENESGEEENKNTKSGSAQNMGDAKVGICIYQFSDTFMGFFREELVNYLVSQGFSEDNITVADGEADQDKQDEQIQEMIDSGVDVLIINPVSTSSAAETTDLAVDAGIPLVYINREPDSKEEQRWTDNNWNVTYVGMDARQSGTLQGDIIVDLGLSTVDINGDKTVQYIMLEGDPENIDTEYRTEFSVKALTDAGWTSQCVYDGVGNFDKDTAKGLMDEAIVDHPEVEVVFCNNDSMALGALESIEAAGRTVGEDIFLVGVDALEEALNCVIDGSMTGTVFNDYFEQSHRAGQAAINYIKDVGNDHYIGCDYVKVTSENAQDILDSIK